VVGRPHLRVEGGEIFVELPRRDPGRSHCLPDSETLGFPIEHPLPDTPVAAAHAFRRCLVRASDHEAREFLRALSGEWLFSPHPHYGACVTGDRRIWCDVN
jgi:hypothetical protein